MRLVTKILVWNICALPGTSAELTPPIPYQLRWFFFAETFPEV